MLLSNSTYIMGNRCMIATHSWDTHRHEYYHFALSRSRPCLDLGRGMCGRVFLSCRGNRAVLAGESSRGGGKRGGCVQLLFNRCWLGYEKFAVRSEMMCNDDALWANFFRAITIDKLPYYEYWLFRIWFWLLNVFFHFLVWLPVSNHPNSIADSCCHSCKLYCERKAYGALYRVHRYQQILPILTLTYNGTRMMCNTHTLLMYGTGLATECLMPVIRRSYPVLT